MVGRGLCSHRGQMASKKTILEIYWGTPTVRGAGAGENERARGVVINITKCLIMPQLGGFPDW